MSPARKIQGSAVLLARRTPRWGRVADAVMDKELPPPRGLLRPHMLLLLLLLLLPLLPLLLLLPLPLPLPLLLPAPAAAAPEPLFEVVCAARQAKYSGRGRTGKCTNAQRRQLGPDGP